MKYCWLLLLGLVLAACGAITPGSLPSPFPDTPVSASPTAVGIVQPSPTAAIPSEAPAPTATSEPAPPPAPTNTSPAPAAGVNALPDPQTYTWDPVMSNLEDPIGLANAGDGSGRLFIVEQAGLILAWKDGALLPEPFLDIRDRVGRHGSEQGLLGLAFHPHYAENSTFYVNYTDQSGDTHISRFSVTPGNPDTADANSEKLLIFVKQPYPNHNGGSVVFGPDGYLYLGLGDGGAGGDPQGNGQSTETLLGKILRIDVDSGDPYAIPPDNSFANGGGLPEIWAYGLRNPWRFSFDPQTGDMYIADVGQNKWEEIDYLPTGSPPGANFGWDFREGLHRYEGVSLTNNFIDPVAEYDHGQGCSVTGGFVYRGLNLPAWQGVYLYGDYCSGKVWGLLKTADSSFQNKLLFETGMNISSFGVDEAGELYLVNYAGTILRLTQ